ncbi:MAG: PepSY domain-containing protein [Terricaulis sp.]
MTQRTIRAWLFVHKWTSLVCTAFLLMLCVTGLPLIFHHEIDAATEHSVWRPAHPNGDLLDLDTMLKFAMADRPAGEIPVFMSFDDDRPVVNITSGAPGVAENDLHFASFDRTSGAHVPPNSGGSAVTAFLLKLHTDLFLGLPGMLFLGAMGVLFVAAIVSGVVVYAPFMRKLPFGIVRTAKSPRVKWLDLHNLLGVVTVAWVLAVGLTGIINTLATPIIAVWKAQQLSALMVGRGGEPRPAHPSSLDAAVHAAVAAAPDMQLQFVAFPGSTFSTDHHYAVFLHGKTPLTAQLITPVLIDAKTGAFVGMQEMPWYAKALSLSQPLHFGDYGGLPLKILWALLDLITIIVLASGLYLWLTRNGGTPDAREASSFAAVTEP